MNSNILSCDQLKGITGYQRSADVARCLRDQGVRVFYGRNGPWTTLDLINLAGGFEKNTSPDTLTPDQIL